MAGKIQFCVMAALRVAKPRASFSRGQKGKHKWVPNESSSESSENEDGAGETTFRKGSLVRVLLHNFL